LYDNYSNSILSVDSSTIIPYNLKLYFYLFFTDKIVLFYRTKRNCTFNSTLFN